MVKMEPTDIKINRYKKDWSLSIFIDDNILITPMSSCAIPLLQFFRMFIEKEPSFPRKEVFDYCEEFTDLYHAIEDDPENSWSKLKPLWLYGKWTAWLCTGVLSVYIPIDRIKILMDKYDKLAAEEEVKAL